MKPEDGIPGSALTLLRLALDEAERTKNGARLADYAQHIRALIAEVKELTAHGKALREMLDGLQHQSD